MQISESCQTCLIIDLGMELMIKLSFLAITDCLFTACIYVSAMVSVCESLFNHMPAQIHGNKSMRISGTANTSLLTSSILFAHLGPDPITALMAH